MLLEVLKHGVLNNLFSSPIHFIITMTIAIIDYYCAYYNLPIAIFVESLVVPLIIVP